MSIYDWLENCCQSDDMKFYLFDLNTTERVVEDAYNSNQLQRSDWSDYEVLSFDLWYDEKERVMCCEFNISVEEDE